MDFAVLELMLHNRSRINKVDSMPTTVSTRSNAPARNVQAIQSFAFEQMNNNAQLQLTALLQTTIELEPLFELFYGQMQHLLKINSCHYTNPDKSIDIKLGKSRQHSCDYSLSIQQQFIGELIFTRQQRFSEEELNQIELLLSTLVYPLRNALNYREALNQAMHDPLTGLGNRGALESALEHQWQVAQRYEQDMSVLMIDIDHFKNINDQFGHDVGDYVIKQVAKVINSTTRQTDLAFRYGGEEFLVILNKTNELGSNIIAERIRENIESLHLNSHEGHHIPVTASIGGCHLSPKMSTDILVKQADKSLYKAKENGRNQVIFHKASEEHQRKGHLSV